MKRVLFLPRRVRFLVRVVVVSMLVALVTLGGELAIGARANSAPASSSWSGRKPLTLMVKDIQATLIDQAPAGTSLADERAGHSHLYNEQGTREVGRADFVYIITDTAIEPNTIAAKATLTFTFPHGSARDTIEAAGISYRPSLNALPPDDVYAITGGTGSYRGVEGQVRLQLREGVLFYTFSFR
jgi:hypothetical protein